MKPAFILAMTRQKRNTIFRNMEKPYWVRYCDVEGGCEFKTADELVNAPIYNGKSLKSRWDKVVIVSIESFPVDDWIQCFCHV